jgi:hypothetical protein
VALELRQGDTKAIYRRAIARKEQGDLRRAREGDAILRQPNFHFSIVLNVKALADVLLFQKAGGSTQVVDQLLAEITAEESTRIGLTLDPDVQPTSAPLREQASSGFRISLAAGKGLGVFATKPFRRGDLILAEAPIFIVDYAGNAGAAVVSAIKNLDPDDCRRFYALANCHPGKDRPFDEILGIYQTNSISIGDDTGAIFEQVSRFNHSCSSNARYSWHAQAGRERVYALRDIAVDEEIFVSYLSRVYGSPCASRQARLSRYNFTCRCVACALQGEEAAASDARRTEITRLYESIDYYSPMQSALRLRAVVRALHLLQEEGYPADADDFTVDATAPCAYHSDWASAKYWAEKTVEIRVAEFGIDSVHAVKARETLLDLRKLPEAGNGPRLTFSERM